MRLEFEFEGDTQVDRTLLRFKNRSDDMRPVMSALADDFLDLEERQFASQGRTGSGGWRRLSQRRIEEKARKGLDPRILHATLALRRSLTGRNDPNHVRRVTSDSLFVGTALGYAVHHQHGAPRANLPRRRPVELTERDRRRWIKALQRYLIEGRIAT